MTFDLLNPTKFTPKPERITKENIKKYCDGERKRICFSHRKDLYPKRGDDSPYPGLINFSFKDKIIKHIFPYDLFKNKLYGGFWRSIQTEKEFEEIETWCEMRKEYVYLRDSLTASAALSFNKVAPNTPEYTHIGKAVADSKETHNETAINNLITASKEFINRHPFYQDFQFITAVPAPPDKEYDLPRIIVEKLVEKLEINDITCHFKFNGIKKSAKQASLEQYFDDKWTIWEEAKLEYSDKSEQLKGAKVLIVDDNYQAGITIQYIAMLLQQQGASEICGLTMTKTLSDKANSHQ